MPAGPLRRHATSIALVALAAGLGAYVLWIDRDRPSTDEQAAREGSLLPTLQRDDISEITIERAGESFRILRREQGDAGDAMYYVATGEPPRETLADQVAVEQLMQALEFAMRVRPADDADPAATGLEQPEVRLTVHMGRVTYELALGNPPKVPADALFVRLEGDGAFVVRGSFAKDALRPLAAYRSRTILPYVSSELSAIRITGDGEDRQFVRGPWGGFRVGPGDGPRVSQGVFDRLLTSFASITAERFVDPEQAASAHLASKIRVEMVLEPKDKAKPRAVIWFGGVCPNAATPDGAPDAAQQPGASDRLVLALRKEPSPLAVCVPSAVLDDLRMPASAYRDRTLFQLRDDEVEELLLRRGNRELEMARKDKGWHVRKPVEQDIRAEDADSFLASLLALEAEIVTDVDLKGAGLEPPSGIVRVLLPAGPGPDKQPERTVQLGTAPGAREDDGMVVRREQDGILLRLSADQSRLLVPSTTLVRSTRLVDIAARSLQRIEVTHQGSAKQIVTRSSSSGFEMLAPARFSVDASLAGDLFQTLEQLSAERWVSDRDDGSFGFGSSSLVVTFEVAVDGGVDGRRLLLGEATVDGRYGRFEPDTGVFVMSRTVENTLRGWVIDRSSFMVDPNEVRAIRLVSSTRDARIEAKGTTWSSSAQSKPVLPDNAVATVREALLDLRADGVVHLGKPRADEGFDKPLLRIEVHRVAGRGARSSDVVLRIGRGDVWRNTNAYYARRDGIDATFAIPASKLRPLLDLLAPDQD